MTHDRTLPAVLSSRSQSDDLFLVCDEERLSYRELYERSTAWAKALIAAGASRGTHVGLLFPNGADFAVAAVAAMRIGAVAVPLSTLATATELRGLLDTSGVRILLAAPTYRRHRLDQTVHDALGLDLVAEPDTEPPLLNVSAPALRYVAFTGEHRIAMGPADGWRVSWLLRMGAEVPDEILAATEAGVRPADPLVIVHTSGSTGSPKAVVHAHGALLDHLRVLNDLRAYEPADILFSNSPFFWIGGFAYTFLGTLVAGATVLCSRESEPAKVLDLLERERPTMCNGYAASAAALAADPSFPGRDLSSIRRGNLYSIMPPDVRPTGPSHRSAMLGLTEGGSVVLAGPDEKDLPEHLYGSFGRPTPDLEARLVDPGTGNDVAPGETGELWLRGPAMMLGYHGVERAETFDADGWFHTGDLMSRNEEDHWFFHGRDDDMIKTAGANVSPTEVRAAIRAVTGLDSVVFGLPDEARGQVVAAVLVTGIEAPVEAELRSALKPMLSAYKIPRVVVALPETGLPLKAGGKVDTSRLKALVAEAVRR